jgi:hypothetical protein
MVLEPKAFLQVTIFQTPEFPLPSCSVQLLLTQSRAREQLGPSSLSEFLLGVYGGRGEEAVHSLEKGRTGVGLVCAPPCRVRLSPGRGEGGGL